jgi:hypothetical protein
VLSYKAFGAGIPDLIVQSMCKDVADTLTATGTDQATAYEVTTAKALFSTVASATGCRLSPQASAGDSQVIFNAGGNPLMVYPPVGAKVNSLPTNGGVILARNTGCEFHCMSTTQWFGVLSA